jgi:RNase P subunit RPR2
MTTSDQTKSHYEFDHTNSFRVGGTAQVPFCSHLDRWNAYKKSLLDAQRDRLAHPEKYQNGLMCPKCDGTLYDTLQVMSQSPTMLRVKCQNCNFRGERYE